MFNNRVDCDVKFAFPGKPLLQSYDLNMNNNSSNTVDATVDTLLEAHKFMLAARSSVFRRMFYGSLCEDGRAVRIPDIDMDVFNELLRYDTKFSIFIKLIIVRWKSARGKIEFILYHFHVSVQVKTIDVIQKPA